MQSKLLGNCAFPYDHNIPSVRTQSSVVSLISGPISFDLVGPEFGSRLGQPEQVTVFVSVPIAAIHEDHGAPFWQNDIGLSRKIFTVEPETVSEPM